MADPRELLRRQEEWQRAQAKLSWAEKIRIAEAARASIALLRTKRVLTDGNDPPPPRSR